MTMVTPTVYMILPDEADLQTTFIRAQMDRLPANVIPVYGFIPRFIEGPTQSQDTVSIAFRKIARLIRRQPWEEVITGGYAAAFRTRPAAVVAQYGPTGMRVIDACRRVGLPLIVHFHGYDASVRSVIAEHGNYARLFEHAAAIVAVSHDMRDRLIALGASPAKVHYAPCGVDCSRFTPRAEPSPLPVIVAAGRLVEKKAPHLLLSAFAEVRKHIPDARLHLIGDGPLMGPCRDLIAALQLDDAVALLGRQNHDEIAAQMANARCFAQHSVVAMNGDMEGTPVAVMEAGAAGIPSVSTRHAGIADVVIDGETGFIVEERDIQAMADALIRLLRDRELAAKMGAAARRHVVANFEIEGRVARLWQIIEATMTGRPVPAASDAIVTPQPIRA